MPEVIDYETARPARGERRAFQGVVLFALLILGPQLFLLVDFWLVRSRTALIAYAVAPAAALLPPVWRGIAGIAATLAPGRPLRTATSWLVVTAAAGVALYATARAAGRTL